MLLPPPPRVVLRAFSDVIEARFARRRRCFAPRFRCRHAACFTLSIAPRVSTPRYAFFAARAFAVSSRAQRCHAVLICRADEPQQRERQFDDVCRRATLPPFDVYFSPFYYRCAVARD